MRSLKLKPILLVAAGLSVLLVGCRGVPEEREEDPAVESPSAGTTVRRTSDVHVVITHRCRSSVDRVYAAMTEPELLRQWLGSEAMPLETCEVDPHPGGSFRYVFRAPDGSPFGMGGRYEEVVPNRRLVSTEAYDGSPWPPLHVTTVFEATAGGTRVITTVRHPSREICDLNAPNLERGTPASFTRLEALLEGA